MSPNLSLKPPKESEIQAAILEYLKLVPGVTAWRNNTGAFVGEYKGKRRFVRFGFPGLADIIGWIGWCGAREGASFNCSGSKTYHTARFLAIEVKRPGAQLTRAQAVFIGTVNRAGGLAIVATCVDDVVKSLGR